MQRGGTWLHSRNAVEYIFSGWLILGAVLGCLPSFFVVLFVCLFVFFVFFWEGSDEIQTVIVFVVIWRRNSMILS